MLEQLVEKAIEEHWPKVQKIFQEKVKPTALEAAKNDEMLQIIFISVYHQLPFGLRLVIKKDSFIKFCFKNRDRLFSDI